MSTPTRRTARVAVAAGLALLLAAGPASALDLRLTGRGNGHGIGMSQYGAQGQALDGRSHAQILSTYYAGTGLATRAAPHLLRVGVALDQPRIQLVGRGGTLDVRIGNQSHTSAAGAVWEVAMLSSGKCRVTHPGGATTEWSGSADVCIEADPRSGARVEVRRPVGGKMVAHHQYGRSSVVEVLRDAVDGTWRLDTVVRTPLEEYLLGLAEMPYSWEPAALRAQAIAGRSYALHRLLTIDDPDPDRGCSCHLYDSQQDQVWKGWDREQSEQWSRWRDAVQATEDRVVHAPGAIGTRNGVVQAFYSSSSNGRTEAKHELWGGDPFPYLTSVQDPWSQRSFNPHRSWVTDVATGVVAKRLGIDRVDSVAVTARSTSSAATTVVIEGVEDGRAVARTRTGQWLRENLGLRSTTVDQVVVPPFVDDEGNIHQAAIVWLANEGITAGCNPPTNDRFCPDAGVTRGQMAAFLTRALDLPDGPQRFRDTADSVFRDDIAALAAADITRGCNPPANDRYCPDRLVTRAEMATFLQRALDLPDGPRGTFRDVRPTDTHARGIAALAAADVTRGCNPPDNDRYCPDDPVTRAQMATFLRRGLA